MPQATEISHRDLRANHRHQFRDRTRRLDSWAAPQRANSLGRRVIGASRGQDDAGRARLWTVNLQGLPFAASPRCGRTDHATRRGLGPLGAHENLELDVRHPAAPCLGRQRAPGEHRRIRRQRHVVGHACVRMTPEGHVRAAAHPDRGQPPEAVAERRTFRDHLDRRQASEVGAPIADSAHRIAKPGDDRGDARKRVRQLILAEGQRISSDLYSTRNVLPSEDRLMSPIAPACSRLARRDGTI